MSKMQFRAWNGQEIIYDIAISATGMPLRRETTLSALGLTVFIAEPSWIVNLWSGFEDRDGEKIFGDDVVELGGANDDKIHALVIHSGGRFVIVTTGHAVSASLPPLANYCTPTFVHMIKIVGTLFEDPWRSVFGKLSNNRCRMDAQVGFAMSTRQERNTAVTHESQT